MTPWLFGLLNSLLVGAVLSLALGGALVGIALIYLYGELRALFTDASSFATDSYETKSLSAFRRMCAWIVILAGLTIGPYAIYTGVTSFL